MSDPVRLPDIRGFLVDAHDLPSPQGAALGLQRLAEDPDASIEQFLEVIKPDPALTGYLLRAANSAQYAAMSRTINLYQAVLRLGINLVRVHALALSLMRHQPARRCPGFDYPDFWMHGLLRAELMAALARRSGSYAQEDAFTLGLLMDIGRLAFATAAPDDYTALLAAGPGETLSQRERERFGFDHHELAAVLLTDWSLPTALADIVYWQHAPEDAGYAPDSRAYRLSCALRLAAQTANACLAPAAPDGDTLARLQFRAALHDLDLPGLAALEEEAARALPDWADIAGLPLHPLQRIPPSWDAAA